MAKEERTLYPFNSFRILNHNQTQVLHNTAPPIKIKYQISLQNTHSKVAIKLFTIWIFILKKIEIKLSYTRLVLFLI